MLKTNEFSHTHHLSRVKVLAKYIRRGIPELSILIPSLHKEMEERIYFPFESP